jgi:hypothetical protein
MAALYFQHDLSELLRDLQRNAQKFYDGGSGVGGGGERSDSSLLHPKLDLVEGQV